MRTQNSHESGAAREAVVEQALEKLRGQQGDIPVTDFLKTERNSGLDRRGIDFVVRIKEKGSGCLDIPLQVKSSHAHRRKFEKKRRYHGLFFIPVIVVMAHEKVEHILRRVRRCLQLAVSVIKRSLEREVYLLKRNTRRKQRFVNRHAPMMCH